MRHLVPVLLIASAGAVQAADEARSRLLGLEFGVGYNISDDSRYEGNNVNLGLVIPVGDKFDVVIYHEDGRYYGKQNAAKSNVNADTNEFRFRINAWDNGKMGVKVYLGMGYTAMNEIEGGGPAWSAPTADVGVQYNALRATSGPFTGELNVLLNYRWLRFDEQTVALTDPLSKLGGFSIGLSAGISF